jgi:VWFA-related protein
MTAALTRWLASLLAMALYVATPHAQTPSTPAPPPPAPPSTQATQPVFKASTDVIVIDVGVTSDKGDVVSGLAQADFTLEVDGKPRRIVSAQFLSESESTTSTIPGRAAPRTSGAESFTSNETVSGGRLVLFVFDLEGIPPGGGRDAARAAGNFLDQLPAGDQVGLVALPNGSNVPFTPDRATVREALDHITGQGWPQPAQFHHIGVSEAYDISQGNTFALGRVIERECSASGGARMGGQPSMCPDEIRNEARQVAESYTLRNDTALRAIENVLHALARVDAPKIVVLISGGIPTRFGDTDTGTLSAAATAARATVYGVHLDSGILGLDASHSQRSPTQMEDRAIALHGLEVVAGSTRGTVFSSSGDPTDAFQRIAREVAGYYLVSADALPADRDGRTHKIKVSVSRPGVTVRARREFIAPNAALAAKPMTPEEQVASVLRAPMAATGLPLRVATYSLRAPTWGKVRVLVATDIGRSESGPLETTIGYTVVTPSGKAITNAFDSTTAQLIDKEASGPVHTTIAIDLVPGKYRLKLAVVDKNGRRGSVDHSFEASLSGSGGLEAGDLLLTPPTIGEQKGVRLTAEPIVEGRALDAYVEIYGAGRPEGTKVTIEVADTDTSPVLTTVNAPVSEGRDKSRLVAEAPLPLGLLPPGTYTARVVITSAGSSVKRARQFHVSRGVAADDVFKNELVDTVGQFDPKSVLIVSLLRPAVTRAIELDEKHAGPAATERASQIVAGHLDALEGAALPAEDASLLASFLRGLALYRTGKLEEASKEFRASVRASPDFLPGVFYLGACYAAGGNARQAAGAWQTALIADDPPPEVYQLVAESYLRLGDGDEAANLLQEAGSRWPDDPRFAITSALARAANGHVTEALAGLKPVLEGPAPGSQALGLAVRLAAANMATADDHAAAEATFRALATKLQASGADMPPLAVRWIAYLDKR